MIELTIDGRSVQTKSGRSVLAVALDAGIYIPHLCYHPAVSPLGGCKLCAVEIDGTEGIVQSCETEAKDGMVIRTETESVNRLRRLSLELLLAGHPDDCTSCKVYLKCELQSLIQYLGVVNARMRRIKKENVDLAAGPADALIRREAERCVQCGRCVRVCEELRGVGALTFAKRNGESYVGIWGDVALTESDCRFCGACVAVCPTGAIQDMPGIFPGNAPVNQALVPCKYRCPAHADIPTYVRLVKEGRYGEAHAVIRERLTFPHTLGIVCTHKCEGKCKRKHLNEAISIRDIKRFAVENDQEGLWRQRVECADPTGKRVAIAGAGPAGLTAAWHLARKGHKVTIFEREEKPGGMLMYGIPTYRLPRDIVDREVGVIASLGIEISVDRTVRSATELKRGYDAALVAVGARKGNIPPLGEMKTCGNVWAAVDFCRMAARGALPEMGNTLAVIGGGNVAFDCARIAKKDRVKTVYVICLESREAMLADDDEIEAAMDEGIEILNDRTCISAGISNGKVRSLELKSVDSFSFGPNGLDLKTRDNSEHRIDIDSLVFATGQSVDLPETFDAETGRGYALIVDETYKTSMGGVFAAGDCVTGTKSVVEAVAAGREAASNIDLYLGGDGVVDEHYWDREELRENIGTIEGFAQLERISVLDGVDASERECTRCLQCDLRLNIASERFWTDDFYTSKKMG